MQPTPLTLFGIPDDAAATMRYAIEIPDLGSLILTHSWNGAIKGLKEWPADQRPPVAVRRSSPSASWSGSQFIMLVVVVAGRCCACAGGSWMRSGSCGLPMGGAARLHRRDRRLDRRPKSAGSPGPSMACCAPPIPCRPRSPARMSLLSLALYIVVYLVMFPTGIAFMAGLVRRGPQAQDVQPRRSRRAAELGPFEDAARAAADS